MGAIFRRYNIKMKTTVDLIIEARWVLPIVPNNTLLEHYAVVINTGKIIDLCLVEEAKEQYQADEVIKLTEHMLMPGLINLHTHAAMTLMRGLADDLPLMPWLQKHIWPAEAELVSAEFVHDGTQLACAEMLSGGTTTFSDMYFFPKSVAEASLKIGMRANMGLIVLDTPTPYANDADHYIQLGLDTRDYFRDESLLDFSFAPHAPYTVSDATFQRIATLADQVNIGVHIHVHETQEELVNSEKIHGLRPLSRLENLGLLGPHVTMAHCVHLEKSEIQILLEYGCSIAHCPTSNLKLASGIAPVNQYMRSGVNVGLGTDGAASNNRLDMLAEMRLAALLAKGQSGDATAVSAYQVLEMATINGAKALNLDNKIGSIEIGKFADLTAVKMSDMNCQPCFDPVSHLVYVVEREQVSHTWVNGDLKYHRPTDSAGVYKNIEPQALREIVEKWQPKVSKFV